MNPIRYDDCLRNPDNSNFSLVKDGASMAVTQEQLLAFAVYEIRLLLADYLGSDSESTSPIRAAAHLAYTLHNEADAVLRGGSFDAQAAIERLKRVDDILGTDFCSSLSKATGQRT